MAIKIKKKKKNSDSVDKRYRIRLNTSVAHIQNKLSNRVMKIKKKKIIHAHFPLRKQLWPEMSR